jgi:serine/threonine protein kinase
MKPERWARIEQIYHAALEREPAERASHLDEACGGDETLRRQVAALLASDDQAPGFIESPALLVAARALAASNLTEARTKAEQSFSLQTGGQIGAYQLLGPIGRGGMGEVHLALDPRLGRKVAIKLLPPKFTADAERVRRFAQEARAASALNHPNIITIHEIGEVATEAGATRYIVTEYVEGDTLRKLMANASERRMKLSEAIDVTSQIAAALSAAHEAGITHRDIKPENVMVRRDRLVKILDFGLAKLADQSDGVEPGSAVFNHSTASGIVMGTPRYMAPEQARGARVDARADIFSLGVMLYEMVAGRAPFTGATAGDVIAAILRDDPSSLSNHAPEVPRELEQIVNKALRKKRDERYQSAGALLDDLKRLKRRLEPEDELNDELAWPGQQESEDDAPAGHGKATPSGATKKQAATTCDVGTAQAPAKNRAAGVWRRRSMAVCVLALVVAGAGWIYKRNASLNKAKAALPRIEELAQAERFFEAYDLAIEAQKYLLNDLTLTRLMRTIADDLSVVTDPPGAQVYLKRFTPDGTGNFTARRLITWSPLRRRATPALSGP